MCIANCLCSIVPVILLFSLPYWLNSAKPVSQRGCAVNCDCYSVLVFHTIYVHRAYHASPCQCLPRFIATIPMFHSVSIHNNRDPAFSSVYLSGTDFAGSLLLYQRCIHFVFGVLPCWQMEWWLHTPVRGGIGVSAFWAGMAWLGFSHSW